MNIPLSWIGIALLAAGLIFQTISLSSANTKLDYTLKVNEAQIQRIEDLKESVARKDSALLAYMNIDTKVEKITLAAIKTIKGYTARNTENEKCLDLSPPTSLLQLLSVPEKATAPSN